MFVHRVFILDEMRSCVKFAHRGPNLGRLAARLLGRILRAAIRDSRQRQSLLQLDIDHCWRRLFAQVLDHSHWTGLVLQKDRLYFQCLENAFQRLDKKFAALFFAATEMIQNLSRPIKCKLNERPCQNEERIDWQCSSWTVRNESDRCKTRRMDVSENCIEVNQQVSKEEHCQGDSDAYPQMELDSTTAVFYSDL